MKKKIFLAVIAVLVICLTCGMLLVACNKDEGEDDTKKPGGSSNKKMDIFKEVILAFDEVAKDDSANEAKEFNFALQLTDITDDSPLFTIATETIEGEDFLYGGIGNDLVKLKGFDLGGVVEELLGWVGEKVSIAGMITINLTPEGFLQGLVKSVLEMAIGEAEVSANGEAYHLTLNLAQLLMGLDNTFHFFDKIPENVNGIISTVLITLDDMLDMGFVQKDKDGNVIQPTLIDFVNYISDNIGINFYFGFGANADKGENEAQSKPFDNFAISEQVVEARKTVSAAGLLSFQSKIEVDALDIATSETPDAGTQAEDVNASYVLDINVDLDPFVLLREHGKYKYGILSMLVPTGSIADNTFKVDFDKKTFKISDITGMLEDAGYIHISLDKVATAAEGDVKVGDVLKNLFTLHYDSATGKVIASASVVNEVGLDGVGIDMKPYSIGGVYDLNALATIMDMLINADKYKETPSGSDKETPSGSGAAEGEAEVKPCEDGKHVDTDPADHVCDICGSHIHYDGNNDGLCDEDKAVVDVMALIGTIFNEIKVAEKGYYSLEKDAEGKLTAATVNFEKLADYIVKTFVTLDAEDPKWTMINAMIDNLPGQVLGGNALRVNIADISFAYGVAIDPDKYVKESELDFNLREDETLTGTADDNYVGTITGVAKDDNTAIEVGDTVTVTGTAIDGTTAVTTTGKVMAIYDGNYYVGIYTDLEPNLDNIFQVLAMLLSKNAGEFEMGDNWPFYGVLTCPVPAAEA